MIIEIAHLPSLRCDVCERVTFVHSRAESKEEIVTAAIDEGWTVEDDCVCKRHFCVDCSKIDKQPWNDMPFLDMPPEDPSRYWRRS